MLADIIPETPLPMRNLPGNRTVIPESPTLSQSTPRPKESGPATRLTHSPNMSLIKVRTGLLVCLYTSDLQFLADEFM